jgi:hypothetical protein
VVYVLSGDLTGSGTIPNLGLRYDVLAGFRIVDGAQVEIEPGNEFLVNPTRTIRIGETGANVVVLAEGTAIDPIRFQGRSSDWSGLIVGPNVSSLSEFDHIEVIGGRDACFSALTPVSVTSSTFVSCLGFGIGHLAGDATDYATSNTFTNVGTTNVGVLP